jgi:hypothetical protein
MVLTEGYEILQGELTVEAVTEDIWMEGGVVASEVRSAAEARSLYGIGVRLGMTKPGEGAGRVVQSSGL